MLARNITFEVVSRVVILVAAFAFIPFLVAHVGLNNFGSWEFLLSIATLGNLIHLPLAGVTVWKVSSAPESERRWVALALGKRAVVLSLILTLGAASVIWISAPAWMGPDSATRRTDLLAPLVLLQGGISAGENLGAALSGLGLNRIASMVRMAASLGNYLGASLCLGLGMGMESLLVGLGVMAGITSVGNTVFLIKSTRGVGAGSGMPPSHAERGGLRYGASLGLGQLAAMAKDNGDRILGTLTSSSEFTALLGMATRLNLLIGEINRYTYNSIIPEIASLKAAGQIERIALVSDRIIVLNAVATGALATIVLANARIILGAWIGQVPPLAVTILSVVTVGTVTQLMLTGPATATCRGLGAPRYETSYIVAGLLLNLGLSPVLVWMYAGMGKVVATTVALSLGSVFFVWLVTRRGFLRRGPFLVAGGLLLMSLILGNVLRLGMDRVFHPSGRWEHLAALAAGVPVAAAAFFLMAGLSSKSVQASMAMLMSLARRAVLGGG